jgi:hypothetical protein
MKTNLYSEIRSILITLKGSTWAKEPTVDAVIQEYTRLIDASKRIRHSERKPALQILFSSRAIDTLLKFAADRYVTITAQPRRRSDSIGGYLHDINDLIDDFTMHDLEVYVRDKRNTYLHQAGVFPTKNEMEQFLHATANGISELINNLP